MILSCSTLIYPNHEGETDINLEITITSKFRSRHSTGKYCLFNWQSRYNLGLHTETVCWICSDLLILSIKYMPNSLANETRLTHEVGGVIHSLLGWGLFVPCHFGIVVSNSILLTCHVTHRHVSNHIHKYCSVNYRSRSYVWLYMCT